jgi:adenylate cyclase
MTHAVQCTVLFADLRGSTALYETLGNTEATAVVTQCVALVAKVVDSCNGRVVKTLGDGLMAVFARAEFAVEAADEVHEALDRVIGGPANPHAPSMRVQVALAYGETIDVDGDFFGDAVNVAARLLDHAGDQETLITTPTLEQLPPEQRRRFRRLDWIQLRGRSEPVELWRMETRRTSSDAMSTLFGDANAAPPRAAPEGLQLSWGNMTRVYAGPELPVVLGRSPEAEYFIDDTRVSRMHARLEWHGGNFQITDLSSNGTYVRYGNQSEIVMLRRASCTLHGRGLLSLGVNPAAGNAPTVEFQVLRFDDTAPPPL